MGDNTTTTASSTRRGLFLYRQAAGFYFRVDMTGNYIFLRSNTWLDSAIGLSTSGRDWNKLSAALGVGDDVDSLHGSGLYAET